MLRTLAALAGCAALVGAAELPVETQTVNNVALKVSNRADVTLKVRDGDKDVKNRELWYRAFANGAWAAWSRHGITFGPDTPITWQPTEGHWQVYVRIEEVSGLNMPEPGDKTDGSQFIIDRTAPVVAIAFPPNGAKLRGGQAYTVTWSVSDPHLHSTPVTIRFARSADGKSTVVAENIANSGKFEWTTPVDMTAAGVLEISAVDKAGNVGRTQATGLVLDAVAPSARVNGPAITATPAVSLAIRATDAGPAGLAAVGLHFSGDDGATWAKGPVLSAQAGAAFAPETLAWQAPGDGTYLLYLLATDASGNASPDPVGKPATASLLVVDATAPKVTLGSPTGLRDEKAKEGDAPRKVLKPGDKVLVPFAVQDRNLAADCVTVYLKADADARWQPVGSKLDPAKPFAFAIPDLATAGARIKVEVVDLAGNVGSAEAAETFRVDNKVEAGTVEVGL